MYYLISFLQVSGILRKNSGMSLFHNLTPFPPLPLDIIYQLNFPNTVIEWNTLPVNKRTIISTINWYQMTTMLKTRPQNPIDFN